MNNLKEKIAENLILKVDFNAWLEKNKKNNQGIKQVTDFYIIGSLPILIKFQDGKDKTIRLNRSIKVKKDPNLRSIQGLNAVSGKTIKKYKKVIYQLVDDLNRTVEKILKDKEFKGEEIQKIIIVKINERHKKRNNGEVK